MRHPVVLWGTIEQWNADPGIYRNCLVTAKVGSVDADK